MNERADLLVRNAKLVATCDAAGRELPGGGSRSPAASSPEWARQAIRSRRLLRCSTPMHHDPSFGAMVRVALAPCSPFSVSPSLMKQTAELAERLDVRLHTHLAEDPDEDTFCLQRFGRRPVEQFVEVGWLTSRSWVAHCIYPSPSEVSRLGAAGAGVAHCPSSNMLNSKPGCAHV
jgi:cytosine/adenosine deaminase-related metal-dependent hydrolase